MRAMSLRAGDAGHGRQPRRCTDLDRPGIDGEGINMDAPPPRAREPSHPADEVCTEVVGPVCSQRPGRPQRMNASLPIEATRARFQTRPSDLPIK